MIWLAPGFQRTSDTTIFLHVQGTDFHGILLIAVPLS
jgi:hypothetical protein